MMPRLCLWSWAAKRMRARLWAVWDSLFSIGRILKAKGLTKRKRKKREKQRDLRAVKAQYRALTHLQMDVKYLTDIAHYWPQMEALGLPRFEYTIRDTKSGALFLGFANQISVTYASLLVRRCLGHLARFGIDPSQVTVQTDRGGEFSGGQRKKRDFGFVHTVEEICGAEQVYRENDHLPALQLRATQQLQRGQGAVGPGGTRPPRHIPSSARLAPGPAGSGIRQGAAPGSGCAWA
jgi:hypothetical protein